MEIFGVTLNAAASWVILAVILGAVEAVTMGLTTIWFSCGAIAAALVAMVTDSILIQAAVFLVVSIAMVSVTKPLAEKKLRVGQEKTNVDAVIGRKGVVTKAIQPLYPGQVRVWGQEWTAVSEGDKTIEENTEVTVLRVEGVKLVVTDQD